MKHLTTDEIIDFISVEDAALQNEKLITRVNMHCARCQECFDAVKAFRKIYDEFTARGVEFVKNKSILIEKATENSDIYDRQI